MVTREKTEGLENVLKLIEKHNDKVAIYALFCGGKNSEGVSWCPDCVVAEPVIEKGLEDAPENSVYIYCSVGDRTFWKDQTNGYRTHEKLRLTGVPTLLKWGTPKRLVEEECAKPDLVKMFFEED